MIGPPTFRQRERERNRPFTRPIFPVWRKMVWNETNLMAAWNTVIGSLAQLHVRDTEKQKQPKHVITAPSPFSFKGHLRAYLTGFIICFVPFILFVCCYYLFVLTVTTHCLLLFLPVILFCKPLLLTHVFTIYPF